MPEHIVSFTNVTKKYLNQYAVNDISFELASSKITALVGPNGSGKSTILKLVAGLVRPSSGSVAVNGRTACRRIAAEVAFLSEKDVLYPFFTVDETIKFYAGLFTDFNLHKAGEILHLMGLEKDKKVRHLSKGNLGRLKITLALSRRAPLILMDEPLAGLDPLARDAIIKSMISHIDLGQQTVLLSTHEVSEIEPVLDMVISLHYGSIKGIEEVEKIRENYGLSLLDWMKKTIVN